MAHAADDIKAFWLTASITTPEPSEMLLDDDTDRYDATSGVRRRAPRLRNSLGGSTAPRVGGRREHSRGNGYDGTSADIFAGSLPAPYAWRHAAGRRRARGRGQRTRVCGWPRGLHGYRFAHRPPWLKAGAVCGCLSFHYPIRPCGRAGYHSLTPDPRSASSAALLGVDTRSPNLPGRSRSACRPGRGRGPHTPSIFCQSSSLRA